MAKKTVAVLLGGRSGEHEVSLQSSRSVIKTIRDKNKYDVVLFGIDKAGRWLHIDKNDYLQSPDDPSKIQLKTDFPEISIRPSHGRETFVTSNGPIKVDIIFPVLHGTYGEDGTLQGLLDMLDMPYVGAGTAGSAIAMDKDVTKRLFLQAGLPTAPFVAFNHTQWNKNEINIDEIIKKLNLPIFVKPANSGSSVGINKAHDKNELSKFIEEAFKYDTKVMCEQSINAREIECAVLGNEEPKASICSEVIPTHEFYDYEAKYIDPNGAKLAIPADIPDKTMEECRKLACEAYKVACCRGMARVDFLMDKKTNKLFLNEINTIPGFTSISMYPKMWAASGVAYPELIDELINLALDWHEKQESLKTDFHL